MNETKPIEREKKSEEKHETSKLEEDRVEFKSANKREKKAVARAKVCALDDAYSELGTPGGRE